MAEFADKHGIILKEEIKMTKDLIISKDLTTAIFFTKDENDVLEVNTVVNDVVKKGDEFIASVKGDMEDKKVRDTIRSYAAKLASSKTAIDKLRKEANAELNKQVKATNAIGNKAVAELQGIQDKVRKPLTDWEDAEKQRVENHNYGLQKIREAGEAYQANWQTASIEDMQNSVKEISGKNDGTWEEFNAAAVKLIDDTVAIIEGVITKRKTYDSEQEELAKLRAEAEEREQKKRDEELIAKAKQEERERIEKEASKPVVSGVRAGKVVTYTHAATPEASEKELVQENMQQFGGSFVQALGVALTRADSFNTARIKNAFPDYWEEYLNFKKTA